MHGIGQQNDVAAAEWIDPDRSAGESGVAVGADGKQFAAIARIWRIDVPAQAAQNRLIGGRLRCGEFLDGGGAEEPDAIGLGR